VENTQRMKEITNDIEKWIVGARICCCLINNRFVISEVVKYIE